MSDYELDLWMWFIFGVWPGQDDSADEPEREKESYDQTERAPTNTEKEATP